MKSSRELQLLIDLARSEGRREVAFPDGEYLLDATIRLTGIRAVSGRNVRFVLPSQVAA